MVSAVTFVVKKLRRRPVPIKGDLSGHKSFFTSAKAEKMINWQHPETE
jgi:hypothetical protein